MFCDRCGQPTSNAPTLQDVVPHGFSGGGAAIPIYRRYCSACLSGFRPTPLPARTPEEEAKSREAEERYRDAQRQWQADVSEILASCDPVERFARIRGQFPRRVTITGPTGRPMMPDLSGPDDDTVLRIVGLSSGQLELLMSQGVAAWFIRTVKSPPTHPEIVVATARKRRAFDALRRRPEASLQSTACFFSNDPRYSDRKVAGWIFAGGQTGENSGIVTGSGKPNPRDIAITTDGDAVHELAGLGKGVFWRDPPTEVVASASAGTFNDKALAEIIALLGVPPLPRRPKRWST